LILFLQILKKLPAHSTFKNIPTLEYVLSSPTEAVSGLGKFYWEEKLVAPLIATPNVDKAIKDK
jgi:hypothetical protein